MPDKATLQEHLQRLTNDWTQLQAAIAHKQQEMQQHQQRIAQLNEEIARNHGAVTYNEILTKSVKVQLEDLEAPLPLPDVPPAAAS